MLHYIVDVCNDIKIAYLLKNYGLSKYDYSFFLQYQCLTNAMYSFMACIITRSFDQSLALSILLLYDLSLCTMQLYFDGLLSIKSGLP